METFVAILHIFVALVLIALVLVQDSKSGSLGGAFGGGGSNSVLGATGATSLAQKMTRWTAVVFAFTCIALSVFSTRAPRSVLENLPAGSLAPAAPGAADAAAPAPVETAPAQQAPNSAPPADAGK